jgi:GTPase SAR1 family protein
MLGLRNSGKSTIVHNIRKFGTYMYETFDEVETVPTLDTQVYNVKVNQTWIMDCDKGINRNDRNSLKEVPNIKSSLLNNNECNDGIINVKIYDLSGQPKRRYLWKDYLTSKVSDCILFVVDLSDTLTLAEAQKTIVRLLKYNQAADRLPFLVVGTHTYGTLNDSWVLEWLGIKQNDIQTFIDNITLSFDFGVQVYYNDNGKSHVLNADNNINKSISSTGHLLQWICGFS